MSRIDLANEELLQIEHDRGIVLWMEDDACPGGVEEAFDRLWKALRPRWNRIPDRVADLGDTVVKIFRLPRYYVFECHSYPGASSFTIAKREDI